jgi:hypothetical protein
MKSISRLYDWKKERDQKIVNSAIEKDEDLARQYSSVPLVNGGKVRPTTNGEEISARLMNHAKIK